MIVRGEGNLLRADADALVNSVNCEGFMGKGIALQFKRAFPANFDAYARACKNGDVQPGRMLLFETGSMLGPRFIINFPTKRKWREKSRLSDVEEGLQALLTVVKEHGIQSIAVPPLGCGLGGLDWKVVKPMIERAFEELPGVRVLLFEPAGAPPAKEMPVRTLRPRMTLARALFLRLMGTYRELSYRLTLLEIQKLAYFLQEAGEPLRLNYQKHLYGPYAHNLNKVLERLEGHHITGYGDSQAPDVEIDLLPGALEEAERFLQENPQSLKRLERVASLIDGFETPYGMELLSSVHWVGTHDDPAPRTEDEAVAAVQAWNSRKASMLKPNHIRVAWQRLREEGWLPEPGAKAP
ncbi:MAG: macro domain-containing protein [Thermoanaerobaculia bacterium]|nr:macro domain-containing protein [Thermoanaerobaculia bacterium]